MTSYTRKLMALASMLVAVCLLASCSLLLSGNGQTSTAESGQTASSTPKPGETEAPTSGPQPSVTSDSEPTLMDYLPLIPDVFLDYDGTGNEYVPMTAWVEFVTDDSIQMSYDNGGTEIHRLYRISDGQIRMVAHVPELYVREDLSLLPEDPAGEVLLQEPLSVGTSWIVNGKNRSISAVDVAVTTPAGTFSTIEVTTAGDTNTTRQYYAPGIGLVKMTITGDIEITQELRRRETPAYQVVPTTLYYGRLTQTDVEILYKVIDVEYQTNIGIREVLTRYFKEPVDPELPRLISPNTTIHSVQLDQETGVVTIDFSPELVTEMNAGSSFEAVIIRSIVNTVGHAYGVEKVAITIDQRPYESGHIALGAGEFFGVDYDDMVPLP